MMVEVVVVSGPTLEPFEVFLSMVDLTGQRV